MTLINHREGPEDKPDYFVPRQMDIVLGIGCTERASEWMRALLNHFPTLLLPEILRRRHVPSRQRVAAGVGGRHVGHPEAHRGHGRARGRGRQAGGPGREGRPAPVPARGAPREGALPERHQGRRPQLRPRYGERCFRAAGGVGGEVGIGSRLTCLPPASTSWATQAEAAGRSAGAAHRMSWSWSRATASRSGRVCERRFRLFVPLL